MNKGSAFIPEGLLPKYSDDPALYRRLYCQLRRKHDPDFRAHLSKVEAERAHKKYWSDPEWRRAKLDKTNEINRRKREKHTLG